MKTFFPDQYIAAMIEHCDWAKNLETYNIFPVSTFNKPPIPVSTDKVIILSHWISLHQYVWKSELETRNFFTNWWEKRPKTCDCKDAETILTKNPIDFSSKETFKESCRRLHNAVNHKLSSTYPDKYYPQVSTEEYQYLWNNTPPRKSPRLVITVATGKYKKILSYSRNSFQAYATKHGADYIELTNEIPTKDLLSDIVDDVNYTTSWHLNKIRVGSMAAQYDQTLFVDVDCIITDKCRDLFQYPGTAIVDDWSVLESKHTTEWIHPEVSMVAESQKLPAPDYWERCLNTGVVLCTRESNPWVMPKYKLPHNHCGEQFWIDLNIDDFVSLPETCNWQWWRGKDFWRGLPSAEVIHFAGCPSAERLELMKWAASEYGIK